MIRKSISQNTVRKLTNDAQASLFWISSSYIYIKITGNIFYWGYSLCFLQQQLSANVFSPLIALCNWLFKVFYQKKHSWKAPLKKCWHIMLQYVTVSWVLSVTFHYFYITWLYWCNLMWHVTLQSQRQTWAKKFSSSKPLSWQNTGGMTACIPLFITRNK